MKQLKGKIKSVAVPLMLAAGDGGTFTGWASTNEPDRYGEIVDPEAFVKHLPKFEANPVMLYQHRVDQPIGSFPVVRVDPAKGLRVRGQLGSGWVAADEARAQVAQGVLRACSIGFRETAPGKMDDAGIFHIRELELLEISLVSVPACASALFTVDDAGKLLAIKLLSDEPRERRPIREALRRLQNQAEIIRLRLAFRDLHRQVDGRVRRKGVVPYASHPTQDPGTPWSASKARASLRAWAESAGGDLDFSKYAQGFTYVVAGQEHLLGGYKLPHHTYSGRLLTNLRGCRAVLAVLAGARGGLDLSDAEKRGVYDHIAKHITDDFHATAPAFADLGKMMDDVTAQDLVGAEV